MEHLQIELVWNREFNWCSYMSPQNDLKEAIRLAEDIRDSGDGARVKKVRVIVLIRETFVGTDIEF